MTQLRIGCFGSLLEPIAQPSGEQHPRRPGEVDRLADQIRIVHAQMRQSRAQRFHAIAHPQRISHSGDRLKRPLPRLAECATNLLKLRRIGKLAAPEEPTGGLERDMSGKLFDGVPGDNQLPTLSVHLAQARFSNHHAFEARG